MPTQRDRRSRDRDSDKPPKKAMPFLHYLAAFALGWHLKGLFPDLNQIVDLLGEGWDWFLQAVQGLGGLAVIGSFSVIIWNIYKEIRERKKAKNG